MGLLEHSEPVEPEAGRSLGGGYFIKNGAGTVLGFGGGDPLGFGMESPLGTEEEKGGLL